MQCCDPAMACAMYRDQTITITKLEGSHVCPCLRIRLPSILAQQANLAQRQAIVQFANLFMDPLPFSDDAKRLTVFPIIESPLTVMGRFVLGFAFSESDGHEPGRQAVFVLPQYQNKGVGRMLIEFLHRYRVHCRRMVHAEIKSSALGLC